MPPEALESFDTTAFQGATGATGAQMDDLRAYKALLEDWNGRMNLVGPSAMTGFWLRHAYDSAQLRQISPQAKIWVDLGTGAGLPGVVLAILLKSAPGAHIHLVESLAKRCVFLSEVVSRLKLPATVHRSRAESLRLTGIDVVTARACAPMTRLLGYAEPVLRGNVQGLFLKGRDAETEVAEARRVWRFDMELIQSKSDPSGRIVSVKRLSHV